MRRGRRAAREDAEAARALADRRLEAHRHVGVAEARGRRRRTRRGRRHEQRAAAARASSLQGGVHGAPCRCTSVDGLGRRPASTCAPSSSKTSRWRGHVADLVARLHEQHVRDARARRCRSSAGMYSGEAPGGTVSKPSQRKRPTASARTSTPRMSISRSPLALSMRMSVAAPGQPAAVRTSLSGAGQRLGPRAGAQMIQR